MSTFSSILSSTVFGILVLFSQYHVWLVSCYGNVIFYVLLCYKFIIDVCASLCTFIEPVEVAHMYCLGEARFVFGLYSVPFVCVCIVVFYTFAQERHVC